MWACGTQVEVEPVERGAVGESCEAQEHCAAGLACIDLVCREKNAGDGGSADGSTAPTVLPTQSRQGESCGRRADCEAGLSCIDRQCRAVDTMSDPVLGAPSRGGRGESCAASNDCAAGLGCLSGACRRRDLDLEATAKECFRVECLDDADCCADFEQDDPELCADLEAQCEMGVQSDCNLFQGLCECRQICDDDVCVSAVECDGDSDCGGSGVLRCVDDRCAQCARDADCDDDSRCLDGQCRSECDEDTDCPLLFACEAHLCEEIGCQSDRECYFLTQNPSSRCAEAECVAPCEDDSECQGPQQGCVEGVCGFVGCETDAECRIVLGLAPGGPPTARASCADPATR